MSKKLKPTKSTKPAGKTIEDIYKKKNPREHILSLPDTYIGSVEHDTNSMWVYDDETNKIVKKTITYVPGFYKTFDELIVNARDHQIKDPTCKNIKITIDKKTGWISVWNDGNGIPVVIHKEEKIYVPEMIFGHLLTSSNYDQKDKTTGGKNGYGAKLCGVFSDEFIVETVDIVYKKKYIQKFTNNLANIGEPKIADIGPKDTPYTKITYLPDFKRFGMEGLDDDVVSLLTKRAYDISVCTNNKVKVYFNDKLVEVKKFDEYIKMHYDEPPSMVYEEVNDRWKVGVVYSPDNGNSQVSYVNGIWTYQGGTHVDYIMAQIVKKITAHIKIKNKTLNIKPTQIRDHLNIFVESIINDPSFSSQTKGELTTKSSNFGTTCDIDDVFIGKLVKTGLVDMVLKFAQFKETLSLKQTDGKKLNSVKDIEKLEDANWAGSRKSKETRLFLTEGDSALAFAIAGLKILGRDKYGAFPLKGKLLNVRNAPASQIKNNEEFCKLKRILGLKQDAVYDDVSKLRYGGIIILCDQDADGLHIQGLIINMLQYFWPELLIGKDFVQVMSTPLLKCFKVTDTKKKNPLVFYSDSDFENWVNVEMKGDISKYRVKYYKGLGTSDDKEAQQVFDEFDKRVVNFMWELRDSEGNPLIDIADDPKKDAIYKSVSYDNIVMAFDKKYADKRKAWLGNFDRNKMLEYNTEEITYSDFINKGLIHFSNLDNIRSIPSMVDGLKPGQRKILHACFRKKQKAEIKVAQLASYVAEHTAYKHGEKSLEETIIGMAQNFPGSNNINLLSPVGNFGFRKQGGAEHASSRYIFTCVEPVTYKIFRKEDELILNYLEDEGESVEPEYFLPILPMILINGSIGVGTGYSTKIPQYNPLDICSNLLKRIDGKQMIDMVPWYQGFKGKVVSVGEDKFKVSGVYTINNDNTVSIKETPIIGTEAWIDNYTTYLRSLEVESKSNAKRKLLSDSKSNCGNNEIDFVVEFEGTSLQTLVKKGVDEVEKYLKLTAEMTVSNLHLYNSKNKMTAYESPLEIIEDFFEFRLKMYSARKKHQLKLLNNEMEMLRNKVKFIADVIKETIVIKKQKKKDILVKIAKLGYPKMSIDLNAIDVDDSDTDDEKAEGNDNSGSESDTETEKENESVKSIGKVSKKSYKYLTDIPLFSLTTEKIDDLNTQYENKKKEYDDYNSTTEIEIWKREINEFVDAYEKWINERRENDSNDAKPKKLRKGAGARAGKSAKSDKSDKPKKLSKPKKTVKKAVKKTTKKSPK